MSTGRRPEHIPLSELGPAPQAPLREPLRAALAALYAGNLSQPTARWLAELQGRGLASWNAQHGWTVTPEGKDALHAHWHEQQDRPDAAPQARMVTLEQLRRAVSRLTPGAPPSYAERLWAELES